MSSGLRGRSQEWLVNPSDSIKSFQRELEFYLNCFARLNYYTYYMS